MPCPWNKIDIPKQTLIELYKNQKLSIAQVASKLGYSNGPVCRLLKEYQISTRTISQAKEKYSISKNELRNLYCTQKFSTDQIAKKFGCDHTTIVYKMRKYGIKSRGHLGLTKPIKISKEKLEYLYHGRKLSAVKIAKILHRSKGGIERKIHNFNISTRNIDNRACKYKKFDFSGNLTEKAYMVGFRLGDLNVVRTKNLIIARCSTTKINQVRLIKNLFSPYTTPHIAIAKRGTFEITAHLNKTFLFLLSKQDNIEPWVLKNQQYFWAFFSGYSDAEGCVHLHQPNGKQTNPFATFQIGSYDKNILQQLRKVLNQLDIFSPSFTICHPKGTPCGNPNYFYNKDMWRFTVNRKDCLWKLILFWEKYTKHKDKQTAMEKAKRNIILRNQLPHCHKIDLSKPKSDGEFRPTYI